MIILQYNIGIHILHNLGIYIYTNFSTNNEIL